MKRLVCVVEGKGEVAAIPRLCARILGHLGISGWYVDEDPIRQPRGALVDMRGPSEMRRCLPEGIRRAVGLALKRRPQGVLVLCDSDDACAAVWGPDASALVAERVAGGAVMAVREYEAWFLGGLPTADLQRLRLKHPEAVRDAKGRMTRVVPGYLPTTHQLEQTRILNIEAARRRCPSFDKLVRVVDEVCR